MGTRLEELAQFQRERDILTNQEKLQAEIKDLRREVLILRKGFEAAGWGEAVEEMEDAELEDVPPKEVDDA